jgi:hypothetical protein
MYVRMSLVSISTIHENSFCPGFNICSFYLIDRNIVSLFD